LSRRTYSFVPVFLFSFVFWVGFFFFFFFFLPSIYVASPPAFLKRGLRKTSVPFHQRDMPHPSFAESLTCFSSFISLPYFCIPYFSALKPSTSGRCHLMPLDRTPQEISDWNAPPKKAGKLYTSRSLVLPLTGSYSPFILKGSLPQDFLRTVRVPTFSLPYAHRGEWTERERSPP